MSDAFKRIEVEYEKAWKHKPTAEEMQAVFNFVFNGWK